MQLGNTMIVFGGVHTSRWTLPFRLLTPIRVSGLLWQKANCKGKLQRPERLATARCIYL